MKTFKVKNEFEDKLETVKIDSEDWPRVKQYKWEIGKSSDGYFVYAMINGKRTKLANFIMRAGTGFVE